MDSRKAITRSPIDDPLALTIHGGITIRYYSFMTGHLTIRIAAS